MVQAWVMKDDVEDQRKPNQRNPNVPVSLEQLAELGVLYWHLDADNHATDPELAKIRSDRGYSYSDVITISPTKLPNYESKIKIFFAEHLHTDEEIRYILDGSGYFDVRSKDERWIRIAMDKGDMIVLPAGMYHRFTTDEREYIQAMRLFVGDPVWTPYNRGEPTVDDLPARSAYKKQLGLQPADVNVSVQA